MTSVGIDIGGTSIKAAILDGDRVLWSASSAPYARPAPADLAATLRALLAPAPLGRAGSPARMGVCVPGALDDSGTRIIRSANMPGLVGTDIPSFVRAALPAGIAVLDAIGTFSDAHAAAHDFARAHALAGRLLAISLGTGVGAAVLDDGRLVTLTGRSSGHFGQMDVTVPGIDPIPVAPDGGRGGLEGYIGLPALLARRGDVPQWLASLRGDEPELAALARAVRIAHAIYRPDHVALLGGIGIRLRPVLAPFAQRIADGLTSLARDGWTLRCGDSDLHAARGAARLAASC